MNLCVLPVQDSCKRTVTFLFILLQNKNLREHACILAKLWTKPTEHSTGQCPIFIYLFIYLLTNKMKPFSNFSTFVFSEISDVYKATLKYKKERSKDSLGQYSTLSQGNIITDILKRSGVIV